MAFLFVPSHVNETSEPVDNLGGILSVVLVGALILAINFWPVPNEETLALVLVRDRGRCDACASSFASGAPRIRSTTWRSRPADVFWVAACAGIIVFGSLMGAAFVSQQYLQNVLGYSTLEAGAAILPAALVMVVVAPRSAKLIEAHGSRFTLLCGLRVPGSRVRLDAAPLERGHPVLADRDPVRLHRCRRRPRGNPRLELAHRIGAREARRHGLRHGRSPARLRRRPHDLDPRGGPDESLRVCDGGPVGVESGLERDRGPAPALVRERGERCSRDESAGLGSDHRRGEVVVPRRRPVGIRRRPRRGARRRGARLLRVPEARARGRAARLVPRAGHRGSSYWQIARRVRLHRRRRRSRRNARVALADRVRSGDARGNGVRHRRSPARSRRRDHAVDLRRAPDGRVCGGRIGRDRGVGQGHHVEHPGCAHEVVRERRGGRTAAPPVRRRDHRGREAGLPRRRRLGLHGRSGGDRPRCGSRLLHVPEARGGEAAARRYHAQDTAVAER